MDTPITSNSTPYTYGVVFDMNTKVMESWLGRSYNNGYRKIGALLMTSGLDRLQGSFYDGAESEAQVRQGVASLYALPWFQDSVRRLHIVQMNEFSDLLVVTPPMIALAA